MLISFWEEMLQIVLYWSEFFILDRETTIFFLKNNIFFFNFYKKELNMAMAVARKMRYAADLGNTLIARLDMDIPGP